MAYNVLNIMDLLKNICIDKDLVVQLLVGAGGGCQSKIFAMMFEERYKCPDNSYRSVAALHE